MHGIAKVSVKDNKRAIIGAVSPFASWVPGKLGSFVSANSWEVHLGGGACDRGDRVPSGATEETGREGWSERAEEMVFPTQLLL